MEDEKKVVFVDLDQILESIGSFGKFQIYTCVLIILPSIIGAWYTTAYIFAAEETSHRCLVPECEFISSEFQPSWLSNAIPVSKNGKIDSCKRYAPANNLTLSDECPENLFNKSLTRSCDQGWIYENDFSIYSAYDIGCEQWMSTLVGTMNNVGQFIGAPISGLISDIYGRRTILVVASFLGGIVGILKSFAPVYWMFITCETLEAAINAGNYSACFILSVELAGKKGRTIGALFIPIAYCIGEMLMGGIAWLFPYWKTLIRIIYTPSLFIILYYWLITESTRWLLSKGEYEKVGENLKKIAKVNGSAELSNTMLENLYRSAENTKENSSTKSKESSLKNIFKSKILLGRMTVCSIWWISCAFIYYGLSINSVTIAGNQYLNFILVSAIELPGYLVCFFTVDVLGRKVSQVWSFMGAGIACLAFVFIPIDIYWLKLTVYMFGKFCVSVAFSVVYIYTSELFPTPWRNFTMNFCYMMGRIGSMLAPQSPLLTTIYEPLPLLLFSAASVLSGLTSLILAETNRKKLPDTIEEAENISRTDKK